MNEESEPMPLISVEIVCFDRSASEHVKREHDELMVMKDNCLCS